MKSNQNKWLESCLGIINPQVYAVIKAAMVYGCLMLIVLNWKHTQFLKVNFHKTSITKPSLLWIKNLS